MFRHSVVIAASATAIAITAALSGPAGHRGSAADRFGPKLGKAFSVLFNDMGLVRKGQLGVTRASNVHKYTGYGYSDPVPSQIEVATLESKVAAGGYTLEEGIFTGIPSHLQPFVPMESPDGRTAQERGKESSIQAANAPKSRVIMWMPVGAQRGDVGLFPMKDRVQGNVDPALVAFGNRVYNSAKSHPQTLHRGSYTIYAAPVRFEHEACLKCHTEMKLHSTAAVAVFAFKKIGA